MSELPGWLNTPRSGWSLAVALFLGVQAWHREQQATRFSAGGGVIEIRRAADGHYHWPGRINGRAVEFLVDTGATGTAIPAALADELGLPRSAGCGPAPPAAWSTATWSSADLALQGGVHAERLRMAALPALDAPLLGMDVLGRLRWQQQHGVLRIDLRPDRGS